MPEIKLAIISLGGADPAKREQAASEIFEHGLELARVTAEKWFADPEFASSLVSGHDDLTSVATVGIAVEHGTFERIRAANGSPPLADVPPDQDAKEFELDFPGGVRIDVLTTRDPLGSGAGSGAIAKYLKKFGEGIQQIEIDVRDVDRATQILRGRFGLEPIYPATRSGAGDTRVNFFLVPGAQDKKILVELVERSSC